MTHLACWSSVCTFPTATSCPRGSRPKAPASHPGHSKHFVGFHTHWTRAVRPWRRRHRKEIFHLSLGPRRGPPPTAECSVPGPSPSLRRTSCSASRAQQYLADVLYSFSSVYLQCAQVLVGNSNNKKKVYRLYLRHFPHPHTSVRAGRKGALCAC